MPQSKKDSQVSELLDRSSINPKIGLIQNYFHFNNQIIVANESLIVDNS